MLPWEGTSQELGQQDGAGLRPLALRSMCLYFACHAAEGTYSHTEKQARAHLSQVPCGKWCCCPGGTGGGYMGGHSRRRARQGQESPHWEAVTQQGLLLGTSEDHIHLEKSGTSLALGCSQCPHLTQLRGLGLGQLSQHYQHSLGE